MLCGSNAPRLAWVLFQSSPALTGGCYASAPLAVLFVFVFQSSPALTGGCYAKAMGEINSIPSFNPHPPLRADAISTMIVKSWGGEMFQSSPALTGGCYEIWPLNGAGPRVVSILTRPYGRMLFYVEQALRDTEAVSILTRPYGRML